MGIRFGRYETLEPIAAGGMAKVYRGRALAEGGFERIVAIKVMHAHLACDPAFVDMFLDEARLAARIQHPNVVATYDVQRSPVGTFLVMDYVDGVDFGQLQRALRSREVKVPIEITLKVVTDALAGLAAAHELTDAEGAPLQLVHRDVSPQNILIDRNTGSVKLTDFGVAHAAERLGTTEAGALKGKLGYLSPEHARDGNVDLRSDLYSAGVVLWEALTGRPMFVGRARVRVVADILQGRLEDPRLAEPSIPEAISAVCMKALSLLPEERFQSAHEFAQSLRSAARAAGIELADSEALRDFIQASGVEAPSRQQPERAAEEDATLVEEEPQAPPQAKPTSARGSRRVWVVAACAAGLLALVPLLEPRAPSNDRAATEPPAPPDAQPGLRELRPAPPEQVEVTQGPPAPPAEVETKARVTPRKAPPRRKMYHPKGL